MPATPLLPAPGRLAQLTPDSPATLTCTLLEFRADGRETEMSGWSRRSSRQSLRSLSRASLDPQWAVTLMGGVYVGDADTIACQTRSAVRLFELRIEIDGLPFMGFSRVKPEETSGEILRCAFADALFEALAKSSGEPLPDIPCFYTPA